MKKQKINVVFNNSQVKLTKDMESVLNRGLNFCITPLKLDLTQVLVEFRRFERKMIWKEYFHEKEEKVDKVESIFKTRKTNMPKKHKTPNGLKNFLASVKSEIMDPKNRHKVKSNISENEKEAIKTLIKLQRNREIIIKPCDKGGGIIILDFKEYEKSCDEHLNSKNSNGEPYYEEVYPSLLLDTKAKIATIVLEGYETGILSKDEYNAMKPSNAKPGKFYATFKVHKPHKEGTAPPMRPIVSASGSVSENIATYVEHHLKDIARSHEAYLQDTPDFLREIQKLKVEEDDMLVVIDVEALYTNIPPTEAADCVEKRLDERLTKTVPTNFIMKLLQLILKQNIFEFSESTYMQLIGIAMGTKPAPSIANIFMDEKVDKIVWILAKELNNSGSMLKFMKRFLDDIFMLFKGSTQSLHTFIDKINNIHPSLKFTMTHTTPKSKENTCTCEKLEAIPFLDTLCRIKNGKISTNLYKKPTDKNQYLLTNSCHPTEQIENIPLSCATRINRICSEQEECELQFQNLKGMLMDRGYTPGVIDAAIAKARAVPREVALRRVSRQTDTDRPVYVVGYNPQLSSIPNIVQKHWRSMVVQDQYLEDVFKEPPMVAFKRNKNMKEILVRAKVPKEINRIQRNLKGMRKCGGNRCKACPYIKEGRSIKGNKFTWQINKPLNCESKNVVYMLECNKEKCKLKYIGETERNFRKRIYEHLGYARNKNDKMITGEHFNLPGHTEANMTFTIIEQCKSEEEEYRKEREKYHISKFNTYYQGMNKEP